MDGTIPLRGAAFLEVVIRSSTHYRTGAPGYLPADKSELVNVNGWNTFRQVAFGGSFEGYTTIGLGVRARLPFRVFTLSGPGAGSRLVIDVAHQWTSASDLPAPTSTAIQAYPLGDDRNAELVGIRSGAHLTFDRLVFDFRGPQTGLRYVVLYRAGKLEVNLEHATVRNAAGVPSYRGPTTLTPDLSQLKVVQLGTASTEATAFEVTLRHQTGFRAFRLMNPDRIVVDVAH